METSLRCLRSCYGPDPAKATSFKSPHSLPALAKKLFKFITAYRLRPTKKRRTWQKKIVWGEYCSGKTNIICIRDKFNNRQKADERIDAYANVLRDLASSYNNSVKDRIVCEITSSAVRKKLLQIPGLTHGKCMDAAGLPKRL